MNETQILNEARQIESAEERNAYLARVCEDDPELKARIEERLRADEGQHSPFDITRLDTDAGNDADDFGGESAGEIIGPYRLVRPVGQGGMGSVWLAEQEEPVRRQVALKIIKAGMDTGEVIARFEAERQALAMMDHPNIARVLDAGATDRGRPFFVMELVNGVPVTKYCDSKHMSTEMRLELFCTICHAIQHAHQKGIIHRDIKPSNVLVTEIDGEAIVKVIDFGLAKATDTTLSDNPLFTQLGQIIGTPAYMSPEQADAGLDIDTRTDVYSLGVLLYELLTGVTPLDVTTLQQAALAELQRMIREYEPPRMSNRISSLGEQSVVAASNRATDSRRLAQKIRGDLDVIAMKALEKDRNRRYETPDGFAADVQRYLNREVIEARPASAWYRMQKFWARNRIGVGAAAMVVFAMVAGTVVSVWQAVRANEAADAERAANEQSQQRLVQIEKGSDILGAIFKDIDLRQIEGDGKTLEQVLGERLKEASAQLTDEAVGDPTVMAKLQALLGESLYSLGYFEESVELFQKATESRLRELGPDDAETLKCQHNLAESYILAGEYDRAIEIHEDTLTRSKAALGDTHYDTISSMKDLGNAYVAVSDYEAGLPLLEEALRLARETVEASDQLTLTAMNSLAVGYHYDGRLELALPLYEETLALRREVYGADHYDTMTGMNNLASGYYATGDVEKALPLMQEVYDLRLAKLGAEHPHTIISMTNLAVVLEGAGKGAQALPLFEEALTISETKNGPEHPGTLLRIRNLANCCKDLGLTDRALELFQEYVDRHGARDGQDSLSYADALIYVGFVQVELERWDDAATTMRECLTLREQHLAADDWRIAGAQSLLGAALVGLEKLEEAEPLLIAGYQGQKAQQENMPGNAQAGIALALERLIAFYETRDADGDAAEAEKWKAERKD